MRMQLFSGNRQAFGANLNRPAFSPGTSPRFSGGDLGNPNGKPPSIQDRYETSKLGAEQDARDAEQARQAANAKKVEKLKAEVARIAKQEFPTQPGDSKHGQYSLFGWDLVKVIAEEAAEKAIWGSTLYEGRYDTFTGRFEFSKEAFPGKGKASLEALCAAFRDAGILKQGFGHDSAPWNVFARFAFEVHPEAIKVCREFLFESLVYGESTAVNPQFSLLWEARRNAPPVDWKTALQKHNRWMDGYEKKWFENTRKKYVGENGDPVGPGISLNTLAKALGRDEPKEILESLEKMQELPGIGPKLFSIFVPQYPDELYSRFKKASNPKEVEMAPHKAWLVINDSALLERCLEQTLTLEDFADRPSANT